MTTPILPASRGLTLLAAASALAVSLSAFAKPQVKFETIHAFRGSDGSYPQFASLVKGANDALYGVTALGGDSNNGVLFRITTDGDFKLLYSFTGGMDGSMATAIFRDDVGNLYGDTSFGGANGYGTVFRVTGRNKAPVETIHAFDGVDGNQATSPPLFIDGNFYGVTGFGGNNGYGAFYRMTPAGDFTLLYSFSNSEGQTGAYYGLTSGSDGLLYGTTYGWVTDVFGAVFTLSTSGEFHSLYTFSGGLDGGRPTAPPLQGSDGQFYGVTLLGGEFGCGTVYRLGPSGIPTTVHSFTGGADGCMPFSALTRSKNGRLYGTTQAGGSATIGTLFEIGENGTVTGLYSFTGGLDGAAPNTALTETKAGTFIGMTNGGGRYGRGVIFKFVVR
ncbi:MAG: choice-of-anchor tandem repeat GloVer-containing protein [Steroidobacteraceae bacterium]